MNRLWDEYNRFLIIIWLILMVAGNIFEMPRLIMASTILVIYILFRMFSKNKQKRFYENQRFLTISRRYTLKAKQFIARAKDKTHNYYRCPKCKQYMSVPKGVGKICIVCAKCKNQFVRNSK